MAVIVAGGSRVEGNRMDALFAGGFAVLLQVQQRTGWRWGVFLVVLEVAEADS